MTLRILLVQSELQAVQPLERYFKQRGDEVWYTGEFRPALELFAQHKPHLLLLDLHFPGNEWIHFLRQVRQSGPDTKVIMTNKFPDLQRELLAREQNVYVFLRQPFSARWIEQALQRLEGNTQPVQPRREVPTPGKPERLEAQARVVRVPMRVKITLPYLLLALLFALGSAYVVSRVVLESVEDRYINQLIETGKQSSDWMVREENRLLETLRLVANTQGMVEALQRQDAEALRSMILPVAVNSSEEIVEILGPDGISLLSLRKKPGGEMQDFVSTRGEDVFRQWAFVRRVAAREVDASGDKFAGWSRAAWGDTFYVSGPVHDSSGNLVGIVLVGKSLQTLIREMGQETLGEITLYDPQGQPVASTLYNNMESFPLPAMQVDQAIQDQDRAAFTRDLTISSIGYTEILGPWEVRGGDDLGVLGVSLAKAFLVRTSTITRIEIFVLVASSILLVLLVGITLANRITRPLLRLVSASGEVAHGNLEVKVDARGNDEVAVLAQSFNYMIAGLQEGSIYRDLLGRTVSPAVREQLRQTFTSGNLRLEGQQALATVLMCDIRGFTPVSELANPATVFQWLNEYFAQIVPIVAAHGGVVNKFDGDAMLAFFGILPRMLSPKQSAVAACQVALEMLEAINALNELRAERGEPLLITGVGVNTGVVIAGGLGTSDRLHYTIIGDTVNTTQRIEGLTRNLFDCSGVLISESTLSALGASRARFDLQPMGIHYVKGKAEPLTVYRLLKGSQETEPVANARLLAAPLAVPVLNQDQQDEDFPADRPLACRKTPVEPTEPVVKEAGE